MNGKDYGAWITPGNEYIRVEEVHGHYVYARSLGYPKVSDLIKRGYVRIAFGGRDRVRIYIEITEYKGITALIYRTLVRLIKEMDATVTLDVLNLETGWSLEQVADDVLLNAGSRLLRKYVR